MGIIGGLNNSVLNWDSGVGSDASVVVGTTAGRDWYLAPSFFSEEQEGKEKAYLQEIAKVVSWLMVEHSEILIKMDSQLLVRNHFLVPSPDRVDSRALSFSNIHQELTTLDILEAPRILADPGSYSSEKVLVAHYLMETYS